MRKSRIYLAILIIPVFGGLAARILRVIIAFHLRELGVSIFEITILSSTFMLARGIFSPILGHIADKGASRYLLVVIGFVGLSVDSLIYPHVSYSFMLLLRSLDGIYGALAWPTMQALVHFHSPQNVRSRLMTSYFMMGGFGGSIGYIVSSYLMGNLGYAVLTVAVFYLLGIFLSYPLRNYKVEKKSEKVRMKVSGYLYSLSLLYGMFFSLGGEVLWFYLAETMHLGNEMAVTLLFYLTVFALLGTFLVGHISDKKGYTVAMWFLALLAVISSIFLAINNLVLVLLGTAIFYVSGRGFLPVSRSFAATHTRGVGTSLGFVNLTSNLGSVVAPLIGGALMDHFEKARWGLFNVVAFIFIILAVGIVLNTYLLYLQERSQRLSFI